MELFLIDHELLVAVGDQAGKHIKEQMADLGNFCRRHHREGVGLLIELQQGIGGDGISAA